MPIKLKPGDCRNEYEIIREINTGAFAFAYEAKSARGEKVFFKLYKSPTPRVSWYEGFVAHQQEVKRRINSDPAAKDRCYRFIEFFSEQAGFHQVFEFVEGGKDLRACLAERTSFTWQQLVVFAKVMMFGIKALHQIGIVHTDLKPENIILIPDASIGMGYKLRIIDLDWAILSDKTAPWHGVQGYVGTPMYQSPEHLAGKVPVPASDIFTCGVILGEILGNRHPLASTAMDYDMAAKEGRCDPIRIVQPIDKVDNLTFLEGILNSCLDPDPVRRPTAAQVCDALIGKTFAWHNAPPPPTPTSTPKPVPVPTAAHAPAKSIDIVFNGKVVTSVRVDTDFGKQVLKNVHDDAKFLSNPQFRLLKRDDKWFVQHDAGATNETIVNGRRLEGEQEVTDGMVIAVGNSSKGVEKLPLTFHLKA